MKKLISTIILLIILIPIITFAGGSSDDEGVANATMIRATCMYRSTSSYAEYGTNHTQYNYSVFDFSGIGYVAGGPSVGIKSYYNIDLGTNYTTFSEDWYGSDYIINYNKDFGVKFTIDTFMFNKFNEYDTNEETLQEAIDNGEFCPSNVYEVKYNGDYEYMFCDGYNSELGVNTCTKVSEYLNENHPTASIKNQSLYEEIAISNNGQEDMTQTDVKDKFVEVQEELEDTCDESSANYDEERCKAKEEVSGTIVDQAADQGISEKSLYEYKDMIITPIQPDILNCESLLGSTTCSGGKNCEPAFYLQIVFTVMKYVAIVILIVMSMMDFLGAVGSSDDNAMKKAFNKCIIRLIICVIIFVMPTILEYLFTWMKVYTPSTCGIK